MSPRHLKAAALRSLGESNYPECSALGVFDQQIGAIDQ
jgi:hypothetical protein